MAIIEGGSDHDTLVGGDESDQIYGLGGNDTLYGGLGNDSLYGGDGNDLIRSGQGRDRAWGGSGNDTLRGGDLQHTLHGGAGDDWVLLAADNDYWPWTGPVRHLNTGYGGGGNDLLQTWGQHDARLFGGAGVDTARLIYYSSAAGSMVVGVSGPDAGMTNSTGQRVTFDSIERLEFFADFGDHTVYGGDLDDVIYVGAGADWVEAGAGDDTVGYRPNVGHYLDGGEGIDTLVLEGISRQPVYFVVQGSGAVDDGMLSTIRNFEVFHVFGQGRADDFITLGNGNDTAEGFAGNDSLYGGGGSDRLIGGAGADGLAGGDGNDFVNGGGGNDLLYGEAGDDRLRGGTGDDTIWGGGGADRFIFTVGDGGGDLIMDFASGTDSLLFSAALLGGAPGWAGRATADDLAFGAATAARGQFVLVEDAGAGLTRLLWDPDGTGAALAELRVTFQGLGVVVTADDLVVI